MSGEWRIEDPRRKAMFITEKLKIALAFLCTLK